MHVFIDVVSITTGYRQIACSNNAIAFRCGGVIEWGKVTGELLLDEAIEGHILIECFNYPVSVTPDVG